MMLSYENRSNMAQSTMPDHLPISTSSASNSLTNGVSRQPKTNHSHIWLITGPAGCGKSTVAQYVAKAMNLPYIEGDEVCTHQFYLAHHTQNTVLMKTSNSTTHKQMLKK